LTTNLEQRVRERTLELEAANERLTELDRLKTKFIADVTHELRTPLTVLSTRVYLLQHSPPEKHPAYLLALKEQLERLTNFVNATLDLSRLEMSHERMVFGSVDLNDVVTQVLNALQPRAEIAGLDLTFRNNPIPEVKGEFNQLAQVVTNLVANAINYTANGSIKVETAFDKAHNHVTLEVTDTGMGISENDIPHLFTRFYRGERAGQSSIPGTGLGLSIVKETVDLHEGQISVKSQVGKGTTFTIYLPVYKQSEATAE
jgi:signal transduction histidine kinase